MKDTREGGGGEGKWLCSEGVRVLCVKCWCDVMCSPPMQVLGLHLTYRTPKRVVFDSMLA